MCYFWGLCWRNRDSEGLVVLGNQPAMYENVHDTVSSHSCFSVSAAGHWPRVLPPVPQDLEGVCLCLVDLECTVYTSCSASHCFLHVFPVHGSKVQAAARGTGSGYVGDRVRIFTVKLNLWLNPQSVCSYLMFFLKDVPWTVRKSVLFWPGPSLFCEAPGLF